MQQQFELLTKMPLLTSRQHKTPVTLANTTESPLYKTGEAKTGSLKSKLHKQTPFSFVNAAQIPFKEATKIFPQGVKHGTDKKAAFPL